MSVIDRLITDMESLQTYLAMKRIILQRECMNLELLLRPWNPAKQSAKVESDCAIREENINVQPPQLVEPDDEIDVAINEDMQRVNKLLERVRNVRGAVKDEEVCNVCNIDIPLKSKKITSKGKAAESLSNGKNQKSVIKQTPNVKEKKPVSVAKRPTAGPVNKTSYQSAYKAPRSLPGTSRRSSYAVTQSAQRTTAKSALAKENLQPPSSSQLTTTSTSNRTHEGSAEVTTEPAITGAAHGSSAVAQECGAAGDRLFSLQSHGKELKIPRALKFYIRLNRELRGKLKESHSKTPVMSDRLGSYFSSVQRIVTTDDDSS